MLVAGVPVLAGGALTGATPGRGIRRSPAAAAASAHCRAISPPAAATPTPTTEEA